jgi:hypothetical protein
MIQYETKDSPFFVANKNYCETIENKLKTMNLDCSGFCNSYGYDIETTFKRNNLTYNIKFHKHQSAQNGVVIPVDALEYAGIELKVSGLNKKYSLTVGKSSFRRLFTSKEFKDKIPSPYFISSNYSLDSNFVDDLAKKIEDGKMSKFKLSKGALVCEIHTATTDPFDLIADIEKTTKNWV